MDMDLFNMLNLFRRLDDLLIDPYVDEGFYREMIKYFTNRLKKTCNNVILLKLNIFFSIKLPIFLLMIF